MTVIMAAVGKDGYVVASDGSAPKSEDNPFRLCPKYIAASAGLAELDDGSVRDALIRRRTARPELTDPKGIADDLAQHLVETLNATKRTEALDVVLIGDRRGPVGFRVDTKDKAPGTYSVGATNPALAKSPYMVAGDGGVTSGAQLAVHKFFGTRDRIRMLKQLPEDALKRCAEQAIVAGISGASKNADGTSTCGGEARVLYQRFA